MKSRVLMMLIVGLLMFTGCDSDNDFPDRFDDEELTLFDKTWISSDGVDSLRFRLNSNGTYNGGTDDGFDNQGEWNWVDEDEIVMRIAYDNTVIWYMFEDLTITSVITKVSEVNPYVWDQGTQYSLSN